MIDGVKIRILGDFGPFSRMGKSIGYEITTGKFSYLLDCGSPIFQQIGSHELKKINGVILTHCHDDHKRWFTDLILFNIYEQNPPRRIPLITSEDIHSELIRASGPALDRSLSPDSENVIDIDFEHYIDYQIIGPYAKYRIVSRDEGLGRTGLYLNDSDGNTVEPNRAKIIISQKTKRPRMLFKDPEYGEWVEPESFYPFSSDVFYKEDKNTFRSHEGVTFEAIKAPAWHGIPNIGIKVKTDKETIIFSSDTVNNVYLWKRLYTNKRGQRLTMSIKEFESASVIYGDINDYIERAWSEERYKEAISAFKFGIVFHDISEKNSVVHTDYERLRDTLLTRNRVILTHSPDQITSEWVLGNTEKTFKIKGNSFFEVVDGKLYPMDADVYHRDLGRYYVGYRNEEGRYTVYEKEGILRLSKEGGLDIGTPLFRVDIYEDISGKYFPIIEDRDAKYMARRDGQVELIEFREEGTRGRIVDDCRERLRKK
jgi:ribonuclease BN (tRNA processing enzyme)